MPPLGWVRRLVDLGVSPELRARAARLPRSEIGELGVDPFGYDPEVVAYVGTPAAWLYRRYFRVDTLGLEHVPTEGPVLLVGNHSGQLPFDGLMIGSALLLELEPPRMLRAMVERWVPRLPWVSTLFARSGQIVGTPDNARRLLEKGEVLLVFPEGIRGISKTWDRRYQLQRFGTGFMRLALATGAPIVPVGVVGAEEQAPSFANLEQLARFLGVPAFPITPTFPALGPLGLLPLPTRYHLRFGPALRFEGDGDEEEAAIGARVGEVRAAIERLMEAALDARPGIFR